MTKVQAAYLRWVFLCPDHEKGTCCYQEHYRVDRFKADDAVCLREKAWREYVRARDNNPDFPHSGAKELN